MSNAESKSKALPLKSWREHIRASLALGIPLVGGQLGLMLMNTTDTVMLGWYGVKELAGGVLATQAYFLIMIFGAGIAQALLPMVGQAEGSGDVRAVRRMVRMGLWLAILYALITSPLFFFGEDILLALGQNPEVASLAGQYLVISVWALFPTLLANSLRAFLTAVEHAQIILWSTLGAAFANIVINYMLIFGNWGAPELGIRGAAYATLIVNIVMFGAMAIYIAVHRRTRSYEVFTRFWRPDWPAFFDLLRLGLPMGVGIVAEVGMFIFASIMIGWLGVVALAAHGIVMQIAAIAFMVPLGMSQAATVRVSNAMGRGDPANLVRAAHSVMIVAVCFAAFSATLFFLLPEALVGLFLDETQDDVAAVAAYAVPLLFVAAVFQLVDSAQIIAVGQLRGLKDTKIPMLFALFAYWGVGMSVAYLLGIRLELGGVGVWSGLASGLAVACILAVWRFGLIRPRTIRSE
ncbi:MAG: MATE family efflux transporter [Pseudomonadota bacterium]